MVWCRDKNNGAIFGYVKCSARSNFSEKYVDNHPQEDEDTVISKRRRLHEDLWGQKFSEKPKWWVVSLGMVVYVVWRGLHHAGACGLEPDPGANEQRH
jgi:hypothetical protein